MNIVCDFYVQFSELCLTRIWPSWLAGSWISSHIWIVLLFDILKEREFQQDIYIVSFMWLYTGFDNYQVTPVFTWGFCEPHRVIFTLVKVIGNPILIIGNPIWLLVCSPIGIGYHIRWLASPYPFGHSHTTVFTGAFVTPSGHSHTTPVFTGHWQPCVVIHVWPFIHRGHHNQWLT